MIIGVPKEIKKGENRIAVVPAGFCNVFYQIDKIQNFCKNILVYNTLGLYFKLTPLKFCLHNGE